MVASRQMTRLTRILALAALVLLTACSGGAPQERVIVDALYPAYTDEEMAEKATVILLVRAVRIGAIHREGQVIFTEIDAMIRRSFKGAHSGMITITYDGSERVVYESNPLLTVGKEYILFLYQVPEVGRWVLLNGPHSRFDAKGGGYVSPAEPHETLTLAQFQQRFGLPR